MILFISRQSLQWSIFLIAQVLSESLAYGTGHSQRSQIPLPRHPLHLLELEQLPKLPTYHVTLDSKHEPDVLVFGLQIRELLQSEDLASLMAMGREGRYDAGMQDKSCVSA
jgi:hypothetical protein